MTRFEERLRRLEQLEAERETDDAPLLVVDLGGDTTTYYVNGQQVDAATFARYQSKLPCPFYVDIGEDDGEAA